MRRGILILGVLCTLVVLRWLNPQPAASGSASSELPAFRPALPYAADVYNGQATFDLELNADEQILLIVGSLGSVDDSFTVELAAKPISAIEHRSFSIVNSVTSAVPETTLAASPNCPPARSNSLSNSNETRQWRDFHIHVRVGALEDERCYQRVRAWLLAEGQHVRVYLDGDQQPSELAAGVTDELVRLFDEEILPVSRRHLGVHRDVDGDGKFALLLTHWLGKLQGGRTSVGGFVRGSDFHPSMNAPFGNRADVLYLNPQVRTGPGLRTLLAHEYAHAVLFSVRNGGGEEDWLNEAIAHLGENLHGREWSNLDHRLDAFLDDPSQSPLVVADYYRSGRWRDHGCRGATYLFLRWCVDQYGPQLLRQLIEGPETGVRNITRATGVSFEELFRRWTIAMAMPPTSTEAKWGIEPFRFLSLHDHVGDYQLCGPRIEQWELAGREKTLKVQGTAASYLEMTAGKDGGLYRISLRATSSARLQVTVLKRGETDSRSIEENPRPARVSAN